MSFQDTALLLAWVAITLLAFAMSGLLRQIRVLSMAQSGRGSRRSGPVVGSPAPGRLPHGRPWERTTALLFLDRNCEGCQRLSPEIEELARNPGHLNLAVVYPGSANGAAHARSAPVFEEQAELFGRFGVSITPFAVLVGSEGVVLAAEPIGSPAELRAFLSTSYLESVP